MKQMIFLEATDLDQMRSGKPISLHVNGIEFLLGMQETRVPRDVPQLPGPKVFTCPKCGKVLKSRRGLQYHVTFSAEHRVVAPPPRQRRALFHCRFCAFKSPRPQGLKSHERAKHPSESKGELVAS